MTTTRSPHFVKYDVENRIVCWPSSFLAAAIIAPRVNRQLYVLELA
jgi:hypothetical protein